MASPVIWGLPIRIIHWMVAGGVVLNRFVLEEGDPLHQWVGYTVVAFVLFRIAGGLAGNGAEAFKNWPLAPSNVKTFLKNHFARIDHGYRGHNPLASYVYLVIWAVILSLGVTGWMMSLDEYWGEEWLEALHGNLANGLLALVVLHLVGIAVDAYLFKRKTWLAMITGKVT